MQSSEGAGRSRAAGCGRTFLIATPLVLIAAFALFLLSPPLHPGAGAAILERASRILDISPPGEGSALLPSSTAWSGYLLAGIQEASFHLSGGGNKVLFVQSNVGLWMNILRGAWALMAALLAAGGIRLAMSRTPSDRSRRLIAGAFAGAFLLASPLLPLGIRELAPFVPACLVALWIAESVFMRRGGVVSNGLAMGLVLAWFPFLWPIVPIAIAIYGVRGVSASRLGGMLGLAIFLGLVLEPRHLVDLGRLPAIWIGEWKRGGGWGGMPGQGLFSQLILSPVLGPGSFVIWIAGWTMLRRIWEDDAALFSAGAWALLVLLPSISGVRSLGSTQYVACALLAVWAGIALGNLPRLRTPSRLPLVLGLCALGLLLPGRVRFERAARESLSIRSELLRDLGDFIGSDELWVSDTAVLPPGASEEPSGYGRLALVLQRDSAQPGRYDFVYWSRWYSGFRWVLLSSGRVRENLSRISAEIPHGFYRSLESNGDLIRTWGTGESEGYRLYRIKDGSRWTHPLTADELSRLRGEGGGMTWFIGTLGSLYMDADNLAMAAVLFRQGLEWDPESAVLYNNLGAAYLQDGEFELAAATLEEGLLLAPESIELMYNFALACVSQGLHDRAERLLRRVLAERPGYAPAHYELAGVFEASGRPGLAREALRRFLELDTGTHLREAALARLRTLDGTDKGSELEKPRVETDGSGAGVGR